MRHTLGVAGLLMAVSAAWGSPTGAVTGFVKDPSGGFLPIVRITLTNAATNGRHTTQTDDTGAYRFPQLTPGAYSLVAEAAGFKKSNIGSVLVEVDQITRADFSMELGSVTETVEIAAAAPLLETDKSTLSHVVDSATISRMPLNARQFLDLALVTPGVVPASAGALGGFAVAGARPVANVFQVDGVSNMDPASKTALTNFRITDAVQEFAVQTSAALPEFGRGTGATVNIVTRSGGNQVHVSAFEYFRNTHMDATDFFSNKAGGQKAPLQRNQFGATVGGPILRDRTFFFLSYEGFRQVAPQVSSTRVPTAAERAAVTDPISRRLLQFWPSPNATGSTNNYIGVAPARNTDDTGLARIDHSITVRDRLSARWIHFQGSSVTAGPTPLTGADLAAPLSESLVLSETHAFSSRWLNEIRAGFLRNTVAMNVQDLGFNAATIFTDASGDPLPGVIDGSRDPAHSGLPRIMVTGYSPLGGPNARPLARTSNTYELYENLSVTGPFGWSRHALRFGFHIRREELRHRNETASRGSLTFNSFADFSAGLLSSATLLTGSPLNYSRRYPRDFFWQDQYKVKDNFTLNFGLRYDYFSLPAETRNHWVNFIPGLGPTVAGTNRVLDIDPLKKGPAAFVFRDVPFTLSSSAGVAPDRNNFGPMLGFAWSPRFLKSIFGDSHTLIRGGFRVAYDDDETLLFTMLAANAPVALTTKQVAGATKFPWAAGFNQDVALISRFGQQGPGSATVGVLPFWALDPNVRTSYVYQFNFGIQRQLGRAFSMEADYQGSAGHKLSVLSDLNEPSVIVRDSTKPGTASPNEQVFPYNHFGGVSTFKSVGNSNYNGLVATVKNHGRRGVYFQGSYTLGKSLDNHSATTSPGTSELNLPADSRNLRLERGPSSFDIRHRAVLVYGVELPVGPGHRVFGWSNGWNRQILGGWQISGITTLQSGSPFTVSVGGSVDYSGFNSTGGASATSNPDRPDVTRAGPLPQNNRNPDAAFDKLFFSTALLAGRVGTSGRDQYYGPGLQNYDFAAAKSFPLWERRGEQASLQFRADFFNLFNHTNFANPIHLTTDPNFGKITQTVGTAVQSGVLSTTAGPMGGPRLIQLSLRLQF